jgi:WS/DGAT/MGAT family acyltransferase
MQPTDALFWYAGEAVPELRPLVAGLLLLDRVPEPARLRASMQRWMARLPRLRQRVVEAPLHIGLPEWEDDPYFDLEYHARQIMLPPPGKPRQLLDFVGAAFATPLDPLRPLWEAYAIEGLEGGRAACFFKVHHAVMDGVGSVAGFEALTQAHRNEVIHVPRAPASRAPRSASQQARRLLAELARQAVDGGAAAAAAMIHTVLHPWSAGAEAVRAAHGINGMLRDLTAAPLHDPLADPSTGVGRRLDAMTLELPRLRGIKESLGVTLNDLVLTALSGAVGRYHDQRGVHVEALHCMVPINLREPHERAALGNRVGMCNVALPVGERDPLRRLERLRAQTGAAKRDRRGALFPALFGVVAFTPAVVYRVLARTITERINLICTNVPGPTTDRYLAGAKIEAMYPFAPVAMGAPLSVALMSYGDVLGVGIDTDPAAIPDPERLTRYFSDAVNELERIVRRRAGTTRARHRTRTRRAAARLAGANVRNPSVRGQAAR